MLTTRTPQLLTAVRHNFRFLCSSKSYLFPDRNSMSYLCFYDDKSANDGIVPAFFLALHRRRRAVKLHAVLTSFEKMSRCLSTTTWRRGDKHPCVHDLGTARRWVAGRDVVTARMVRPLPGVEQPASWTVATVQVVWCVQRLATGKFLEFQHGTALECRLSSAIRRLPMIQRSLAGMLLRTLFWCAELPVFRFLFPLTANCLLTSPEPDVTRGRAGQWGPLRVSSLYWHIDTRVVQLLQQVFLSTSPYMDTGQAHSQEFWSAYYSIFALLNGVPSNLAHEIETKFVKKYCLSRSAQCCWETCR